MKKNTKIKPSWKNHIIFEENPSISMSSKIFVKIHAVLRKLPYCPCALLPMCPIPQPIPKVPHLYLQYWLAYHLPMCPIAHVPHWPCATLLMCQKHVKLSKGCQIVKKMSNVKKSNTQTMEEVHKKINWHNEVHTYWRQFWRQMWRSPKLFKNTFYAHFEGFWWPSYVT